MTHPRFYRMPLFLLLIALVMSSAVAVGSVEVGSPMPVLTLKDQHDATQTIDAGTRFVVFSAEREVSALVETALSDQTGDSLSAAGVKYVSDISAMPGMVTSVIALPKMRKRAYPMLLGREAEETAGLPREPGKVTLIASDGGTITSIQFIDDPSTLRTALGIAP
jgi:hypothetical protein